MTAFIFFANDPSVGIFSETFSIELPIEDFDSAETREDCRQDIKKFCTGFYASTEQDFENAKSQLKLFLSKT